MSKMSLIKVVMVLTLVVVGLGFYQGWFVLSSPSQTGDGGKSKITLTVDPDKMKEDAQSIKAKGEKLGGKVADGVKDLGDKAHDAGKPESK